MCFMATERPTRLSEFPTLLIVEGDPKLRGTLANGLRSEGYLVLEAQNVVDAVSIVRTHSRPIQLLLASVSLGSAVASQLQQYRHGMSLILIEKDKQSDAPPLKLALEKVRQFFNAAQNHSVAGQA